MFLIFKEGNAIEFEYVVRIWYVKILGYDQRFKITCVEKIANSLKIILKMFVILCVFGIKILVKSRLCLM